MLKGLKALAFSIIISEERINSRDSEKGFKVSNFNFHILKECLKYLKFKVKSFLTAEALSPQSERSLF
ncbi:MAG: hypothetical protein CMC96_01495 [Flavobacteriales bacterium]|nr:hypothetical protein [Flavobacteriales bacterium]